MILRADGRSGAHLPGVGTHQEQGASPLGPISEGCLLVAVSTGAPTGRDRAPNTC